MRIAAIGASRSDVAAHARGATNGARCTDSPVSSRWIQSLTNGAIGASSRHTDDEHLVQRRERRAVVVAVDVVEAAAAQPHVPVRDVVVDELDDRARRGGRVVRVERGVDRLLDRASRD